jgi:hypothetical protein
VYVQLEELSELGAEEDMFGNMARHRAERDPISCQANFLTSLLSVVRDFVSEGHRGRSLLFQFLAQARGSVG